MADDGAFTHLVRPAAGLDPVLTTAPASVFGLAGEPEPAGLVCGLLNTGELLIDPPGAPALRLTAEHTAELIGYLRMLQGGLR